MAWQQETRSRLRQIFVCPNGPCPGYLFSCSVSGGGLVTVALAAVSPAYPLVALPPEFGWIDAAHHQLFGGPPV